MEPSVQILGGVRVEFCAVFRVHLEIKVLFKLYSWFRRKEPYVVGFFLLLLFFLFFFFLVLEGGGGGGGKKTLRKLKLWNRFEAGLVSVISKCWHCDPLKQKLMGLLLCA